MTKEQKEMAALAASATGCVATTSATVLGVAAGMVMTPALAVGALSYGLYRYVKAL